MYFENLVSSNKLHANYNNIKYNAVTWQRNGA